MKPHARLYRDHGQDLPVLVWHWRVPLRSIASGPLGGGIGSCRWVINAQVSGDYSRPDPERQLAGLATELGLAGRGTGMLTAADVSAATAADEGGVAIVATVGLGLPLLAAAPGDLPEGADAAVAAGTGQPGAAAAPGTINIVAVMPAALSDAALVNAVITVTEAKTQALAEAGIGATGTATDAVCVVCPADGPAEPFCGPRSQLGARLARAAHAAVLAGAVR